MGLTGSFVASLVGHHRLRSFGGRFVAPVFAGDALSCTATVRSVRDEGGGLTVELDVRTTTQDGTDVFHGTAVASQ
jgi:acyl dehydratase